MEVEIMVKNIRKDEDGSDVGDKDWEFIFVLEGYDFEIKFCVFFFLGVYFVICLCDKFFWIWEDIGVIEVDDEWEIIVVL